MMASAMLFFAPGFEDLEAITTADLLVRAGVDVVRVGLQDGPIQGSRGTRILADLNLDALGNQKADALVLPGGLPGADHLAESLPLRELLQKQVQDKKLIGAICAAPRALARAGLLEGRRFTCFPGALDGYLPAGTVSTGEAVEEDGRIITSRGPGTAITFGLTLIRYLAGEVERRRVEESLAA